MQWIELSGGKHSGKTLPLVAFTDPGWLFSTTSRGSVSSSKARAQLRRVSYKARRIKLPESKHPHSFVEYIVNPGLKRIAGVHVIPATTLRYDWNEENVWMNIFDLKTAMTPKGYDEIGGRMIVKAIKRYVLGNEDVKMSRKRCEEFYSDERNFLQQ